MTLPQTLRSPVSPEVVVELARVVERWHQLPLDQALSYDGRVRALVQSLADGVAKANGVPASAVPAVPDLGPATLMDQLTVMVYDASAKAAMSAAKTPGAAESAAETSGPAESAAPTKLAQGLATLRRELSGRP
jgi:hypothetical protein